MSKLFIRNRSCGYITFLHDKDEMVEFSTYYLPGRHLVIGDLSTFSKPMKNMLLKLIEENPALDCYSSSDICDPIIQSRFVQIIKDPLALKESHSLDDYLSSDKSHQSAIMYLSAFSSSQKLRTPFCNRQLFKLFNNV